MKNVLIIVKILTIFLKFVILYLILKKKKYIRVNNKPFMTNTFSKAIMQNLQISQNPQENTCTRVSSLIELQT